MYFAYPFRFAQLQEMTDAANVSSPSMVDIANAAPMSGAMAPVVRDLTYAQVIC